MKKTSGWPSQNVGVTTQYTQLDNSNIHTSMNFVFADSNEDEVIFSLKVKEIAHAEQNYQVLQELAQKDKYMTWSVENTRYLAKKTS